MSDTNKDLVVVENLKVLATPDGFQKYFMGTKKDGHPRAVYDIVKDFTIDRDKKKKKKDKKKKDKSDNDLSTYGMVLNIKKKKKKDKKKSKKHWHI